VTTWVNLDGVVLMFGDSGGSGAPANNAIAAALGSTMQQQNDFVNFGGTIQGGVFATAGARRLRLHFHARCNLIGDVLGR
jgi:hypothetical protein